jgi:HSP20 family protein
VWTRWCASALPAFSRELFLGDNLDTEKIAASYDNGVLSLTIPVAEEAKARRIEVTASEKKEAIAKASAA